MFTVKGFFEIAKLRGKQYFIEIESWKDSEGNWIYKVAFTNTKDVDFKKLFGKDIDKAKFSEVKDYDILFKK